MANPPEYLLRARKAFPEKTDLQIEMWLARQANIEKTTGLTRHQHRMEAMRRLFPDRVPLEWRNRKIESYQRARDLRIKEVGWSGSTNSNKTSDLCDLSLELWWESPENTTIYIASPYRTATETNLWARIVEQFDSAKSLHAELPGQLKASQAKILLYDRNPLSFIQVTTIDDLGKLVGKKSKRFSEGLLLIVVDEAPNLPNNGAELVEVLRNLRGVPNFLLLYAGNFADTGDAMGALAEPVGGYESMKGQEDTLLEYETKRKGLLLRFDGHDSPNIKAGRDIYDFVTTNEYLADLAMTSGGTSSPGYMRFGRSFPVLDVAEFRVTTLGAIEAGRADFPAESFTSDPLIPVSFCDPGFGGDPCVIQDLRLGFEFRDRKRRQVCELWGPPLVVPIDLGKLGADGRPLTPEAQIVDFHRKHAAERGIPPRNCGFDGSMRAGIVHKYAEWSLDVQPIDTQGPASDRVFEYKTRSKWKDEMANFTSEHWFAAGLCIQSGQMRSLALSPAARAALLKRPWLWKGNKKQILPKPAFKMMNNSKSPNEADALCGALELLRRLGFQFISPAASGGGSMATVKAMIADADLARQRPELFGRTLPAGRLHFMESETSLNRGRLNS